MPDADPIPLDGSEAASELGPDFGPDLGPAPGALSQVPIEVVISVGRARPLIRDLLRLRRDSVLALDRRIDDPVELYVGDRLIARGLLEELDGDKAGTMAVRLTEVADLRQGL